jgi:hypothetical protein
MNSVLADQPRVRAVPEHPVWEAIAPELSPRDFQHPHDMDVAFLRLLSRARRRAGVPFWVVSDRRAPGQAGVSGSAHEAIPCRCVDLRVTSNEHRWRVVVALLLVELPDAVWDVVALGGAGFNRLGLYPPTDWQRSTHGPGSGSVHVDGEGGDSGKPAPRIWLSF